MPRDRFIGKFSSLPKPILDIDMFEKLLPAYRDRIKACVIFSLIHTFLQSVREMDVSKLAEFILRKVQATTFSSALPDGVLSSQLITLSFISDVNGISKLISFPIYSENALLEPPTIFNPIDDTPSNPEDLFIRLSRCSTFAQLQPFYWLTDFLTTSKCCSNVMLLFEPGMAVRQSMKKLISSNPMIAMKTFKMSPSTSVKHMKNFIDNLNKSKSFKSANRLIYAIDDLCASDINNEPQIVRSLTTFADSATRVCGLQDAPRTPSKLMLMWNMAMARQIPFELLRHFIPITFPTPSAESILSQRFKLQTIQWAMSTIAGRISSEASKMGQLVEILLQATAEVYELIRNRTNFKSPYSPFSISPANLELFFGRIFALPTGAFSQKQVHKNACRDVNKCPCIREALVQLWHKEMVLCFGERLVSHSGEWFSEVVNQSLLTRINRTSPLNQESQIYHQTLRDQPNLVFLFSNVKLSADSSGVKLSDRVLTHVELKSRLSRLLKNQQHCQEKVFMQMPDDLCKSVERIISIVSRPHSRLLLLSNGHNSMAPSWRPQVMLAAAALNFEFVDLPAYFDKARSQLEMICKVVATSRKEYVVRLTHSSEISTIKLAIAVSMSPSTSGILGDCENVEALASHVDPTSNSVEWLDYKIKQSIRFVFCATPTSRVFFKLVMVN